MPAPTHQEIIVGFLLSLRAQDEELFSIRKSKLDLFKKNENASFHEIRDLFYDVVKSNEINLTEQGNSIIERLTAYLTKLELSPTVWSELCRCDFGMVALASSATPVTVESSAVVPEESSAKVSSDLPNTKITGKELATAQSVYMGTFLSLLRMDLHHFYKSYDDNKFMVQLDEESLVYLEKYQDELWAKALLASLLPNNKTRKDHELNEKLGRKYKQSVLSASAEQQLTIHPAILAYLNMFDVVDTLITADKIAIVEAILTRCLGPTLHNARGLLALGLVRENLSYVCLKTQGNPLHKMAFLEMLAPLKNIESMAFSPALLDKCIAWQKKQLLIHYNFNALSCLVYFANQYNNANAHAALKSFLNLENIEDYCQNLSDELLVRDLREIYRDSEKKVEDPLKAIAALNDQQNIDPRSYLQQLKQLVNRLDVEQEIAATTVKNKMFARLSTHLRESAKEDAARENCSIVDPDELLKAQSGFNYADLKNLLADFFADPEKHLNKEYPTGSNVCGLSVFSRIFGPATPERQKAQQEASDRVFSRVFGNASCGIQQDRAETKPPLGRDSPILAGNSPSSNKPAATSAETADEMTRGIGLYPPR